MADIFISYSKADHALALKLSTFLEAEGWSVWWDKSLGAADLYRDEIMKQLAAARAVISIWTSNSIRSDWVRAEAGTAKREEKLIPVKTPDIAYADIPLPFGEMHTENVTSTDLIRAAVVAQLAKPVVQPTAWALLTKGFKYEILTWIGIVGGALTLFGMLDAVLKLAPWARLLVENWKEWTHTFWLWAFGWLGIHLSLQWPPVLSFLLFWSLLIIGQAVKSKIATTDQTSVDEYNGKSFRLMSWRTLLFVICLVISEFVWQIVGFFLDTIDVPWLWFREYIMRSGLTFIPLIILVMIFAKHDRLHATVVAIFITIFYEIIVFNQLISITVPESEGGIFLMVTIVLAIIALPPILLSVAPAKAISRRLLFLAIGLILLIALNELSKLGWDVTAPKAHGV
jgi:hypothetical protein